MTQHKLLHWYTYITLGITLYAVSLFGFYSWWPYKVVQVHNSPYPILNPNATVKQGDLLVHEVDYCKYLDLPSETHKQFINGLIYSTPTSVNDNPIGCHIIKASTRIPDELPPGKYILSITKIYHVNPIREVSFTNKTQEFTVVAK